MYFSSTQGHLNRTIIRKTLEHFKQLVAGKHEHSRWKELRSPQGCVSFLTR